jgi:serine/threonine protein kinase
LKPENILLVSKSDDILIKVADFNYACYCYGDSQTIDTYCGTYGYMAPEILLKQSHGKAVDIWAIGVIIYILLSGTFYFNVIFIFYIFLKIYIYILNYIIYLLFLYYDTCYNIYICI